MLLHKEIYWDTLLKIYICLSTYSCLVNAIESANNSQLAHISYTGQKEKFSVQDFFSKGEKIRREVWICSHLLKKS